MTDKEAFESCNRFLDENGAATSPYEIWQAAVAHERSKAPTWKDAPDAPGLWVSIEPNGAYDTHKVLAPVDFYIDSSWIDGSRYFGPIPEDKP